MATATAARIRRIVRPVEFAVAFDAGVKANYPDAKPAGINSDAVYDSFFDATVDAQFMLNERFNIQKVVRLHEAAESDTPLGFGNGIALSPTLPQVRMIDDTRGLNRLMLIKGLAFDRNTDRNAVEAMG